MTALAGCVGEIGDGDGEDEEEFDTVRIGVLEPLTGAFSDLGEEALQGVELAIDQINGSDEYDFDIEYESYDTQGEPDVATREAEAAIQDFEAQFLMGCISSSSALAINDFAESNEVVYTPGAADNSITGSNCNEYVFRFETNTAQVTEIMAEWTVEELGDQIFYHIADYAYGESVKEEFETRMEERSDTYEEVGETRSDFGSTDFEAFITQIQGASDDADAVVVGMTGADLAIFLSQPAICGL